MHYAVIKKNDIANGPGVRVSLFVSGCRRRCPGCFNFEAWDFNYGYAFTEETVEEILNALRPDYVEGLTLLGGDPMEPENRPELVKLCRRVREVLPGKTIWCYTGLVLEHDLLPCRADDPDPDSVRDLLPLLDVLVDGPYVEAEYSPALLFRGSANQRILHMPETLRTGKAVWKEGRWIREMGCGDIEKSF